MLRRVLLCFSLVVSSPALAEHRLFACEPEWGALARELVGEGVEIYVATTASQDPHHIEARPSLLAAARRSDIIVCTGAELEAGWLPVLLRESGNTGIQPGESGHFMAADHVVTLDVPEVLDRSHGDVHAEGNPHVHLDPGNIVLIANALAESLVAIYPDLALRINANRDAFVERWQTASKRWQAALQPLRGTPVVVQHQSWRYLTHWAGIDVVAELEPKPGIPPSARHLGAVLKQLEKKPAAFIIITNYEDRRGAEWLSNRSGLQIKVLPYTVGAEDTKDLFQWFEALVKGLLAQPDKAGA
jgi:zinc/manganese transport system substrate-binding protein